MLNTPCTPSTVMLMDPVLWSSVQIKETAFTVRNLHTLSIVLVHYLLASVKSQSQFWHLCIMNSLQWIKIWILEKKQRTIKRNNVDNAYINNIFWKHSVRNKFSKIHFSLSLKSQALVVYYITCCCNFKTWGLNHEIWAYHQTNSHTAFHLTDYTNTELLICLDFRK